LNILVLFVCFVDKMTLLGLRKQGRLIFFQLGNALFGHVKNILETLFITEINWRNL